MHPYFKTMILLVIPLTMKIHEVYYYHLLINNIKENGRLHDTMVLSKEMYFDYLSCYSCTNGVTIVANQDHIIVGSLSIGSDSRPY